MFGIERMRGDPEPQLPYTNQFIADLAAMPSVQIVYVGDERNSSAFNAWTGRQGVGFAVAARRGKLHEHHLHDLLSGQQQAVFGEVVPAMMAGTEPDSACVARAAGQFYRALVVQGL